MIEKQALKCVADPGIAELAEGLKVLADPNRLRIVCLLLRGERCVCEVERELGISQQLASHHLNVLRESGLLKARREGTSSYYTVAEERLDRLTGIFLRYLGYRAGPGGEPERVCCASAPSITAGQGGGSKKRGGQGR